MNTKINKLKKASQIKQRIFTASVLAIIIISCICLLPGLAFVFLTILILGLSSWEWCRLIGVSGNIQQSIYILSLVLVFLLALTLFPLVALLIGLIWWLCAIFLITQYPKTFFWTNHKSARVLAGFVLLIPWCIGLIELRELSPQYLLLGLFLVWGTDTGAFIVGKFYGRHKLAANVSPGKTVEGVIGGVILALMVAVVGALLLHIPLNKWLALMLLAILVSLAGVIGDLFESLMKRLAGVKDSGDWLPGHGGILDRIDSLLCAVPVFTLGMFLLSFSY